MTNEGEMIAKRYPKAFKRALRLAYGAQVAYKDFRKILRKMED